MWLIYHQNYPKNLTYPVYRVNVEAINKYRGGPKSTRLIPVNFNRAINICISIHAFSEQAINMAPLQYAISFLFLLTLFRPGFC